ncbi:MAG: hypothetical protein LBT31_00295 [Synergistaceae bacterium]|jgi:hypothetical protein|nr:hypothetical protein [Synergistaceae bacterium]
MRIRLDENDISLDEAVIDEGREAIYNAVKRVALGKNGVIIDILVDGESLNDEEAFFSLSGGIDIQFVSQPIKDLVPESIAEGEQYISRLEKGLEGVATMLEEGRDQEALSQFAKCLEGIDWLISVFGKSCLLLALRAEDFKSGNYDVFIASFNRTQSEILSSMQEGKNLRVAFLVRDGLLPLIAKFSAFWAEVKEQIETPLQ